MKPCHYCLRPNRFRHDASDWNVVFDGVTLLDASGPAEVFRLADPNHKHYELEFISPKGGPVVSSSGMEISGTVPANRAQPLDTLLVAGGAKLAQPGISPQILSAARTLSNNAARVASVCTGAFVLADLGLLNGLRATTHWRHAAALAARYPEVMVEPDVIHIRDGRFMTSAGITAGIDLALAIVEDDLGAEVARSAAQEMVVFMQRPGGQTQFSAALQTPTSDSIRLQPLLDKVAADPSLPHTITSMAQAAGVSERHLNRMFQHDLGTTPGRWLESVRVDAARALLLDGHSVTHAAQLSGFGSDETLRRAFARHLNTTPSAFRERFSTTRPTSVRHWGHA